jgi:hypothetical protein
MNEHELLDRLARAARRESVPEVEVTARVLRSLAAPAPRPDRVFLWMAAGSAAAAAASAIFAFPELQAWADPLAQLVLNLHGIVP